MGSGTGRSKAPKRGANESGLQLLRKLLPLPRKDWAGCRQAFGRAQDLFIVLALFA
jgi:hypothetical protein